MGVRKIKVRQSAAENIASVSLYIESKGMLATAEKFTDSVYDFILRLADSRCNLQRAFKSDIQV